MPCANDSLAACEAIAAGGSSESIFGFGDALTALALIMVFYTFTDARYRFRLAIAPMPIANIGFVVLGLVGFLSLAVDTWFAMGWPVPAFLARQVLWQASFAGIILMVMIVWIYSGFINPPVFSHQTARAYFRELYMLMLRGAEDDLIMIAQELSRSADTLIRLSAASRRDTDERDPAALYKKENADTANYAFDVLLLIGSKKLCRHVVASSPLTVIRLFRAMTEHRRYVDALGPFSANIGGETVMQRESPLYHEDHGYDHGLMGYWRPYTSAVYGDYSLVETMGRHNRAPLDIDYRIKYEWEAAHLEAYTRAVLITWESYLQSDHWRSHSYVLFRAFETISYSTSDIQKLDGVATEAYKSDEYRRLQIAVKFLKDAARAIDKAPERPLVARRSRDQNRYSTNDVYDLIVNAMFEIISHAASVTSPITLCWSIQHNSVWGDLFREDSAAWRTLQRKLRRLLYDEAKRIIDMPNFVSANVLGLCLNVMGFTALQRRGYGRQEYALHQAILKLTKERYIALHNEWPALAAACLKGGVTFDAENRRLVKTFIGTLGREGDKEYLELDEPSPPGARQV